MSPHFLINILHTTDDYTGKKPVLSYPVCCVGLKVEKV